MRLEPTQKPDQTLRVSARLITSSTILHFSADEFEQAVKQEIAENPAIAVQEQAICWFCGAQLYSGRCSGCGSPPRETQFAQMQAESTQPTSLFSAQNESFSFFDIDNASFSHLERDEALDPLGGIPQQEPLSEFLFHQLLAQISPADERIAEQLVGNLNGRGYLDISVEEIAYQLHVDKQRVEAVLKHLQALEPAGIGARDLRECLLIQLRSLSEQQELPPYARTLIDYFLPQLAHHQFADIARQVHITEAEVRQTYQFIRQSLHPFPASLYASEHVGSISNTPTVYIRPDILIRQTEIGFEVELLEEKRYAFQALPQPRPSPTVRDLQRSLTQQHERARFFIDCVQRRWRTLRKVVELIIEHQREFLEKGIRFLRPLTRAEIANRLSLDEGTVSRATAQKFALLPNGRLMSIADFFDGSLGVKDLLRELIAKEEPRHRLSDEDLARILTSRGLPMARRTVAKYREEMGIASSRER